MRIMSVDDFGNYVAYEQVPAWMACENYNFCDEFVESRYAKRTKGFASILVSALQMIL